MQGDKFDELVTVEDLSALDLVRIRQSGIVAVDTEMTGVNFHRDLLCLVQIADPSGMIKLIKANDWRKAKNLHDLFLDQNIIKVFHFALMDCSFILKHVGVEVHNSYCTKIASKLIRTYSQKHSLSAMIEELFQVILDKSLSSTNWCQTDLTEHQLQYAANDVLWLIKLREKLEEMLAERGYMPTGLSYSELNNRCQAFIPTLVHLRINGWEVGKDENPLAVFAH